MYTSDDDINPDKYDKKSTIAPDMPLPAPKNVKIPLTADCTKISDMYDKRTDAAARIFLLVDAASLVFFNVVTLFCEKIIKDI